MSTIISGNPSHVSLSGLSPATSTPGAHLVSQARKSSGSKGDQLRETFTQFVGETFYGQMIKAMRSSVGKPAYFYGGRAEEVFRGQLDQALAEHMTEASADRFAEPMFRQQFPQLATATNDENVASGIHSLNQLSRR